MRLRFAPSPTGHLHVGNLRTALLNYLWARRYGGEFFLRIDDTDSQRSTLEYESSIRSDLTSLGLVWDSEARQSERLGEYDKAGDILRESGHLYDCYESPEELELQRRVNLSQGRPPIYDRGGLGLSDSDRASFKASGRLPHWRFRLSGDVISWFDYGRGSVSFEGGHLSDPVLFRGDGRVLYTLSSVVDDGAFGISHVVRGEDHVVNTAVQIDIFRALGLSVPEFAHVPLLLDSDGKSLSKRLGSLGVRDLLGDGGIDVSALLCYLAHLGLSVSGEGGVILSDLVSRFDMESYGRASPKFDLGELRSLNVKYLRCRSYDMVRDDLLKINERIDEDFWHFIRDNIDNWGDVISWAGIIFDGAVDNEVDFRVEHGDFLGSAVSVLPNLLPSADNFYLEWVDAIKVETGLSGKGLFVPLRLALTGRERGPELKEILRFLTIDEIRERLSV